MARDLQEKEGKSFSKSLNLVDMKLAYQLQQEYIKQVQAEGGEPYEGEEYEDGEGEEEFQEQPSGNNRGPGQAYRQQEEQKSNGNSQPSNGQKPEKKKKKGFGSKIKSIPNIFVLK
jgi:hypothetical protein